MVVVLISGLLSNERRRGPSPTPLPPAFVLPKPPNAKPTPDARLRLALDGAQQLRLEPVVGRGRRRLALLPLDGLEAESQLLELAGARGRVAAPVAADLFRKRVEGRRLREERPLELRGLVVAAGRRGLEALGHGRGHGLRELVRGEAVLAGEAVDVAPEPLEVRVLVARVAESSVASVFSDCRSWTTLAMDARRVWRTTGADVSWRSMACCMLEIWVARVLKVEASAASSRCGTSDANARNDRLRSIRRSIRSHGENKTADTVHPHNSASISARSSAVSRLSVSASSAA